MRRTPLLRSSVRNLSAFWRAEETVSLFPAKITYKKASTKHLSIIEISRQNLVTNIKSRKADDGWEIHEFYYCEGYDLESEDEKKFYFITYWPGIAP